MRGIVRCKVNIYTDFSDIFQSFPCGLDTAVADVLQDLRENVFYHIRVVSACFGEPGALSPHPGRSAEAAKRSNDPWTYRQASIKREWCGTKAIFARGLMR